MNDNNAKTCFVIAPIGDPDSSTRRRSDQFLRHIIRPAVEAQGYTAIRADEISEPGIITSQVIQHVVDDALVVADLTERNPNVFYELAVRHAIRKPFIQIINKGETIPFDVAATRTVIVDHHDLDNVEEAKTEIRNQITSLEADSSTLETPISVSLDLQHLRRSENPGERSLADVLSELSRIRSMLSDFEKLIVINSDASQSSVGKAEIRRLEQRLTGAIQELPTATHPSRRRRQTHQFEVLHLAHSVATERGRNAVAIPILISILRDDVPWAYEIGMQGYRQIAAGQIQEGHETIRTLLRLLNSGKDTIDLGSDIHMVISELEGLLRMLVDGTYERP